MFDEILKDLTELEDLNNGIIKRQKEYISKLENYVSQLEETVTDMKKILDDLLIVVKNKAS